MATRFIDRLRSNAFRENWGRSDGMVAGYYLTLPSGCRHWFGGSLDQAKKHFDGACDEWLSAKAGWQYGVEYSHGSDAHGRPGWDNLDLSDYFA